MDAQARPENEQAAAVNASRRTRLLMYMAVLMLLVTYLYQEPIQPPESHRRPAPMKFIGAGSQLRKTLAADKQVFGSAGYPTNISDTFHGMWRRTPMTWKLPPKGNISLNFLETVRQQPSKLHFSLPAGAFRLQIVDIEAPVDGLQVIGATLHLADGAAATDHDLRTKLMGVYIPAIGRMALASTYAGTLVGVSVNNGYKMDLEAETQTTRRLHEALQQLQHGRTLLSGRAQAAVLPDSTGNAPHVDEEGAGSGWGSGEINSQWRGLEAWKSLASALSPGHQQARAAVVDNKVATYNGDEAPGTQRHLGAVLDGTNNFGDGAPPAQLPIDRCGVRMSLSVLPTVRLLPGSSVFLDAAQGRRLVELPKGAPLPRMSNGRMLGAASAEQSRYPLLLRAEGVLSSPNCSFVMNVTMRALSVDQERLEDKTVSFAVAMTLLSIVQMGAVIYQLNKCANQSAASRTSMLCVGIQAILDSYACLLQLVTGFVWQPWFNAFAVAAFGKLVLFSILEMRLLLVLWNSRRPQAFADGWASLRRELTLMYARFYCSLLAGMLLVYIFWNSLWLLVFAAFSFWIPQIIHNAQHGTKTGLAPVYIGIMSSTRLFVPLYLWACPYNFVASVMPYNTSNGLAVGLVLWMGVQVAVMAAQHRYGSQFFVPGFCLPEKYNYHRPISAALRRGERDDGGGAGAGAGDGAGAGAGDDGDAGGGGGGGGGGAIGPAWAGQRVQRFLGNTVQRARAFRGRVEEWWRQRREGYARVGAVDHRDDGGGDLEMGNMGGVGGAGGGGAGAGDEGGAADAEPIECVICTCEVELVGREYMLTPCNHIFHSECLLRWMDVKMECPVCRGQLPPP